jgi:hypothetical protein
MVFDKLRIKLLEAKLKKAKAKTKTSSTIVKSKIKQLSKEGKIREKLSIEADKLKKKEKELLNKISKVRGDPGKKLKLQKELQSIRNKLSKAGIVALAGLKLINRGLGAVSKHMDEVEKRKKKTPSKKKKTTKKKTKKKTSKKKKNSKKK